MVKKLPTPELIAFDFDGVFTDNFVYIDSSGVETVRCSRADGLAIDTLRAYSIPCLIISTESNSVVSARARKLRIKCIHGVANKVEVLVKFCAKNQISLKNVIYVGNDLNDLAIMNLVGTTVCPADAHPCIKRISTHTLRANGGCGAVRELVEDVLGLEYLKERFPRVSKKKL